MRARRKLQGVQGSPQGRAEPPTGKLPRGIVKAYREHLNKLHGHVDEYRTGRNKFGSGANITGLAKATKDNRRLYGDYLYSQDREMFMFNMREELEAGTFKFPV
jgi:hypothetical protein